MHSRRCGSGSTSNIRLGSPEQRCREAIASTEKTFLADMGPFHVSGCALQIYLPPTAKFQIIDVKSVSNIMRGNFVNVFLQVESPDSRTAPAETYFVSTLRNLFEPSGRKLNRTLLVIPTRRNLVVDDVGGGVPVDVFGGDAVSRAWTNIGSDSTKNEPFKGASAVFPSREFQPPDALSFCERYWQPTSITKTIITRT